MSLRVWLVALCGASGALAAPANPPGQAAMDTWIKKHTTAFPAADFRAATRARDELMKDTSKPLRQLEWTPEGFTWRVKASSPISDGACALEAILVSAEIGSSMVQRGSTRPIEVSVSCTNVDATATFLPRGKDQKSGAFLEVFRVQRSGSSRASVGAGPFEFTVPAGEVKALGPLEEHLALVRWRYETVAASLGLKVTFETSAKALAGMAPCWPAFWGGVDRHCAVLASAEGPEGCGAAAALAGLGAVQRELDQGFESSLTRVVRVTCGAGWAAEVSFAKKDQVTLSVYDPDKQELLTDKTAPLPPTASLSAEAPAAGVHARQLAERMAPRATDAERSSEAFARALISGAWFGLDVAELPTLAAGMPERLNELGKSVGCRAAKGKKPELECVIRGASPATPAECRLLAFGAVHAFPAFQAGPLAGKVDLQLDLECEASGAAVRALRRGDSVELSGPAGASEADVGMAEAMMGMEAGTTEAPPWETTLSRVRPLPPKKGPAAKAR